MDKDLSFVDSPLLKTGNSFADYMNVTRLSAMPEYWALVEYLEEKGIIDAREFMEYLGRCFKMQVITAEHMAYREEAEQKLKDLGV